MEKELINEILWSLCDRGGFDDWWRNIDEDIRDEIVEELVTIVKEKLNNY